MSGVQMDWWDGDTEEDKVLLEIVRVAARLARLPTPDEVPNTEQTPYLRRTITYFGSFGVALRKVAELLYGDENLTSPEDLSPQERELSQEEQQKVLQERREKYVAALKELSEPGALNRRRKKQEIERQRERYKRKTEGYVVQNVPVRPPKELRQEMEKRARSTAGLIEPKAPTPAKTPAEASGQASAKSAAKSTGPKKKVRPSFKEMWAQSDCNPENYSEEKRQKIAEIEAQMGEIRREAAAARRATKRSRNTGRGSTGSRGGSGARAEASETGRMRAIGTLWATYRECGAVPSRAQVDEYIRKRATSGMSSAVSSAAEIVQVLGEPETWETQLRNYAGARGLRFEIKIEPQQARPADAPKRERVEASGSVEPPKSEPLKVEPEVQEKQTEEGGTEDMGRGPNIKKEEVLETLWRFYKEYHKMPTWGELAEYREAHPETRVPNQRAFWKHLGEKETWEAQMFAYAREQGYIEELPPEDVGSSGGADVPEGADASGGPGAPEPVPPVGSEPSGGDVPPIEEEPPAGSVPAPEGSPVKSEPGSEPEMPASEPAPEPKEVPEPDEQPAGADTAERKPEPIKLHLALTGLTLKFQLEGKDYELEVDFGKQG